MSWGAVLLFGSGLLFSTGLGWFFVQAWIFAIEARTTWLLVLLTITSTVALLSQTYLCAVLISITPESKPIGVTPVNREAFASFPFDETASLVRRRDPDDRLTFGWEVNSAPNQLISSDPPATARDGSQSGLSRLSPFSDRSEGSAAICGRGVEDDDEEGGEEGGEEKISAVSRWSSYRDADTDRDDDGLRVASTADTVEESAMVASAIAWGRVHSTTLGVAPLEGNGGGVESVNRRGERGCGRVGNQSDGGCVEDMLESGCAEPFRLSGGSMLPVELWKPDRASKESCLGRCRAAVGEGLENSMQQEEEQRHQDTKGYLWKGDASDLGSTVCEIDCEACLQESEALESQGGCDMHVSALGGSEGDADCRENIDTLDVELTKAAAWKPEGHITLAEAEACCPRRRDKSLVRVNELPDVCAICLGLYASGEQVHVLPCLHIFHAQCLDIWITEHPSCPYCKGNLNVVVPERSATVNCTRRVTNFVAWSLTLFHDGPVHRRREHNGDRVIPSPPTAMPSPAAVP